MADDAVKQEPKGTFQQSLYRNNKQIRADRANSIIATAQIQYKRAIEDLATGIQQAGWDLEGLLDLSPTNTQSLVLASDFNALDFVQKDQALRLKIYNEKIKLKELIAGYVELFGENIVL